MAAVTGHAKSARNPGCPPSLARVPGSPITVASNDLLFAGLQWGPPDGPLVLLLHGFPQRSTSWTQVATRLADVGVRTVALDQRGYSPAARPAAVAAYAMMHLVADVAGMIAWLGGGAPVHLAGHDWGGVVGWQVAGRHPDLVASWTAVSTPHQGAIDEQLAADPAERERFGYIRGFRAPDAEAVLLAGGAARLRAFYQGRVVAEDSDVAFFSDPGVLTAALNWYRAMSPADTAGLGPVAVPTSYVWGSDDLAFSRAAAEGTARWVSGPYRFEPLEGASHWLPDEAPDVLAEVIAERVLA